jgi:hypothetical protein
VTTIIFIAISLFSLAATLYQRHIQFTKLMAKLDGIEGREDVSDGIHRLYSQPQTKKRGKG